VFKIFSAGASLNQYHKKLNIIDDLYKCLSTGSDRQEGTDDGVANA